MTYLEQARKAKQAAAQCALLDSDQKNRVLLDLANRLRLENERILKANQIDVQQATLSPAMIDRLTLTKERIEAIAVSVEQCAELEDPVGKLLEERVLYNELICRKVSVPFGLVGMIFESRPNVCVDAFTLSFKSGNAVYLRGGKEAFHTNHALVSLIKEVLQQHHLNEDAVMMVEDTSRESVDAMLSMRGIIDVIIPRGGAGLIRKVVEESKVPVIETGSGICMIYVDESAQLDKALDIIENAKTQRVSVCNSLEDLVIHRSLVDRFVPLLIKRLGAKVEMRVDASLLHFDPAFKEADAADYHREFLDYIMAVKVVDNLDEAITFINEHHTQHSDAILTEDMDHANRFLQEIDAAVVYVNASTRFSDGFEFGFGAEIGISTQKLHVRGPMGLQALTTYKYQVIGDGQIRQ